MDIFYSDIFELPLPDKHRFPMSKYRRLRERIVASDAFKCAHLKVPKPATDQQLSLVHNEDYLRRVIEGHLSALELRRIGFPWSKGLVERSRRSVGASIAAGRSATQSGIAVNLAGGTHHAFSDAGQGYCVFNDVMVAARVLQRESAIENVLVIDLDVHQGNGTASIAREDEHVFAFSIHCQKNYPFRKTNGDLDVGLPEATGDSEYLDSLNKSLEQIQKRFRPDLVFYLAGADPFEGDRLGLLNLTKSGLRLRDQIVIDFCQHVDSPLAIAMAGGYANDVEDIVDIHFETVLMAMKSAEFRPGS